MTDSSLTLSSPILAAIDRAVNTDPRLKSPHSIRQYRSHLARFQAWMDGRALSVSAVNEYLASLQRQGYAPDTVRQHHATIRWMAGKIAELAEEYLDPDEAERTLKQAAKITTMRGVESSGTQDPRGRHLGKDELIALLDACDRDPSPAGRRDKAIIWLAWSNGLRRQTLCDLDLANLERTEQGAQIRYTSKRQKRGTAHLLGDAWQAMQEWLTVRGDAPGPVFAQINKSGKVVIPEQPLSGEAIRKWLKLRFMESGMEKAMTWHTFRYTFAGNLLDEGYDITTVQALMLHASPQQTAKYDRRADRHGQEAILSLSTLRGE